MTDEEIIEIIAKRMDEECGWSKASTVMNHFGWIDVVTHLYAEKGLRSALMDAYQSELIAACPQEWAIAHERRLREEEGSYADWRADVPTRGGA